MHAFITSAALLASTVAAGSVGSAIVVNKCSYDVTLDAVPASGGGYEESDHTLASGGSWSQGWTELSNGAGWSIKLSKDASLSNILQYEYTFQNDGIIWYDLSAVNGNPWDGNWEVDATTPDDSCTPRQAAYRYATDDAYGMQSCDSDAVITVTLCSGEAADSGSDSSSSVAPASTSAAPASSSSAAAPSSTSTFEPASTSTSIYSSPVESTSSYSTPSSTSSEEAATTTNIWTHWHHNNVASPTPTTFATATSTLSHVDVQVNGDGKVVTRLETEVVTEVVTATAYAKREVTHRHHRHNHE